MWRTWNMPKGANSKDVANWIAMACDHSPELQLHHVIIHAHAEDGLIVVGRDPDGSANSINQWSVADFRALKSKDIGCIWLHACGPAATNFGARFCHSWQQIVAPRW